MKRPTRTRDVRAARQAKELARLFGHGTSMPVGDEPPEEDHDFEIPEPDTRRQIGPLDVAPNQGQP